MEHWLEREIVPFKLDILPNITPAGICFLIENDAVLTVGEFIALVLYQMQVAVNNQHFCEFYHRIQPMNIVNWLNITGDLQLTSVRIQ